jgi:hypothetical protein
LSTACTVNRKTAFSPRNVSCKLRFPVVFKPGSMNQHGCSSEKLERGR